MYVKNLRCKVTDIIIIIYFTLFAIFIKLLYNFV